MQWSAAVQTFSTGLTDGDVISTFFFCPLDFILMPGYLPPISMAIQFQNDTMLQPTANIDSNQLTSEIFVSSF